jgi:lipopolysaccharide/colanic/teichoic acid biosynthesis glycosyltransferase/GGDEF domain-containing protein
MLKKLKRVFLGELTPESLENIYSQKEFLIVLNRARAQADRNGNCFALATFDVGETAGRSLDLSEMVRLLSNRIRATDAIGWFDEKQLGVYLFDSNAKDAQSFCEEIRGQIDSEIPNRVYVYPYYYKQNLSTSEAAGGYRSAVGAGLESYEKLQYTLMGDDNQLQDLTRWYCTSSCDIADEYSNGLEPVFRRRHPLWKRAFDLSVASAVLLFCLPVFLSVAILVKIVSPGPVFFKQVRVGYMGRRFTLWKFRTMHVEHNSSKHRIYMQSLIKNGRPMIKMEDDPSIIFLGKYLRASGVDELPQLLNVIRGEMSLIGPRPPIPYEVERYHRWFHGRFDTMPGLTGLWQVSGKNRLSFQEMMRLDIRYKKRLSFLTDIIIILRTPSAIWKQIAEQLRPLKSSSTKLLKEGAKGGA